jgi:hypothetical protein
MRSTARRTSLLRLVLGAAVVLFGWILLSMTQASADEAPVAGVSIGLRATADAVVEPVTATTTQLVEKGTAVVEEAVAVTPAVPVVRAPVTTATAAVRRATAAVTHDVARPVVRAVVDTVVRTAETLPVGDTSPDVEVPGFGPRPVGTAGQLAARAATTRARAERTAAIEQRGAVHHATPQTPPAPAAVDSGSGARGVTPANLPAPSSPSAPAPVDVVPATLPAPTSGSTGGGHGADAATNADNTTVPSSHAVRPIGVPRQPRPGPVADPGSRPD